jgi:hypothetical protein
MNWKTRPLIIGALLGVLFLFCLLARQPPVGQGLLIHDVYRSHKRHTTIGRAPLDEWSARRRELYLTIYDNQNRQTSMAPVEFEPTISAGELPQTYALNRTATGTSCWLF